MREIMGTSDILSIDRISYRPYYRLLSCEYWFGQNYTEDSGSEWSCRLAKGR